MSADDALKCFQTNKQVMRRWSYRIALPLVLSTFSAPAYGMWYLHLPRAAVNYVETAPTEDRACMQPSPTPREIYLAKIARPCYCAAFLPGEILHPDTSDSWEWKMVDDTCEGLDANRCYSNRGCVVENIFDSYRKFFDCAINKEMASGEPFPQKIDSEKDSVADSTCPFYREGIPNQMCRDSAADR